MVKKWSGRKEFAEKCFAEILSDGKPHSYGEICEYTIQQAKGTKFQDMIDKLGLSGTLRTFIAKDGHYQKVRYGVYQWSDIIPTPTNTLEESTNPMLKTHFIKIESLIASLQKEIEDAFAICFLTDKKNFEKVETLYGRVSENLKKTTEGIAIWRVAYEYPELIDLINENSVKAKVERRDFIDKEKGHSMFKIEISNQSGESETFDITREGYGYLRKKFEENKISPHPYEYRIGDARWASSKVKIYSDSDFGNGVLRLMSDTYRLYDAHLVEEGLGNVREELKEEVEQNILHEQYNDIAEMFADIQQMTIDLATAHQTFYCPLTAKIDMDRKFNFVDTDNDTILEHDERIKKRLESACSVRNGWGQVVGETSGLADKVAFVAWTIDELEGKMYGKIDCYLTEELSYEETERLRQALIEQNNTGFGKDFSDRAIPMKEGDLYIYFGDREEEDFLYTQEEMEDYLTQGQGGMKLGS